MEEIMIEHKDHFHGSDLEKIEHIGEFSIKNTNNIPIEGTIYSSSPRMECQTPQFQGITQSQMPPFFFL